MGGSALKVKTRRFSLQEYNTAAAYVSLKLGTEIKHFVTKSYEHKPDFGDLDVLISTENIENSNEMYELIKNKFDTKEIVRNKSVISFELNEFQVDFILINKKHWEVSKVYYSYNDLGNLMGRISYKMGFRYGHEGLRVNYNSPHGGKTLKIYVSRDPKEIFNFLGFDYERFNNGFKDLDEIFRYVMYSKYYTPSIFQYESLNHQNKTRNKKRANYRGFLEYIADEKTLKPLDLGFPDHDFIEEGEKYFNIEIKSKIKTFDENILNNKRNDVTAERLNMEIIQEHFDISGKELGKAITTFRKEVTVEHNVSWQDFVKANDVETIMDYFGKYNNLNFKQN
jgi:hypothetical protein